MLHATPSPEMVKRSALTIVVYGQEVNISTSICEADRQVDDPRSPRDARDLVSRQGGCFLLRMIVVLTAVFTVTFVGSASATKPGPGGSTGVGSVFVSNPVLRR